MGIPQFIVTFIVFNTIFSSQFLILYPSETNLLPNFKKKKKIEIKGRPCTSEITEQNQRHLEAQAFPMALVNP